MKCREKEEHNRRDTFTRQSDKKKKKKSRRRGKRSRDKGLHKEASETDNANEKMAETMKSTGQTEKVGIVRDRQRQ